MLKPIAAFFERKLRNRILSIFVAYIVAVIPLLALLFFFINQSRILFSDLPSVRDRLNEVMTMTFNWVDEKFQLDADASSEWMSDNILAASDVPIDLIQNSLECTGYVMSNIV